MGFEHHGVARTGIRALRSPAPVAAGAAPTGAPSAALAYPVLRRFKRRVDHRRYNGASLVGLRGIVIKSHGSSDAYGFEQAIRRGYDAARNGLLRRINEAIPKVHPSR